MATPEIVVFPNAVPLVISYLAAHLDPGVTVSASVPPNTNIHTLLPLVQVVPQGGGFVARQQIDEVILSIDIYHHAEQLFAIDNLGQQVRAVIASLQGQSFTGAAITRTTELSSISRLPDSDPLIVRVGLTVSLLVRPL
jgi:hypothetical protein